MAYSQPRPLAAVLKNLLLVVLIMAASIGGTLLYSSRSALSTAKADEPPKHAAPAMPSPIYVALDPFTVTLRDNYNRRILYTAIRSEEHTSELQSLMRISYAVFCLKNKHNRKHTISTPNHNRAYNK